MIVGLLALMSSAAWAQTPPLPADLDYSFDAERYRPMSDHYGYAITESASTLKHLQVNAALWLDYSEDPINFLVNGGRVQLFENQLNRDGTAPDDGDGVIDKRGWAHLQAGLGVADVFSLSVDVPVLLWQEGFEPIWLHDPVSFPSNELVSSGIGDVRVVPKFVVVDAADGPLGVALLARITLPTGRALSFIGEGAPTVTPMAVLELSDAPIRGREYHVRVAGNLGYKVRQPANFGPNLQVGNELIYRAGLAVHPTAIWEAGVDLSGVSAQDPFMSPVELLPWMQFEGLDFFVVNAGAGFGLVPGVGSPDMRFFGGVTFAPSFNPKDLDRDGDGIYNKIDDCVNIPEDFDGYQDTDGCPEADNDGDGYLDPDDGCPNDPEDFDGFEDLDGCPDADNDKDTILDILDSCPDNPELFNGFEDQDGCPDTPPIGDTDGDGYLDDEDGCPYQPEDFDRFQDQDGCPDLDNDLDTILDAVDACPNDPEDFDNFEDEDGCPEFDNDRDGIIDREDACPNDPETINQFQDEDGCPDEAPPRRVVIEKTHIVIHDKVFFEVNKAVIRSVSFGLLDEVAMVMVDHPELLKVQIEGHTDSDGSDGYNLDLSQRRAEAVREYLIGAGVDRKRLVARGLGELVPIADNATEEGKATNRRVEFKILEREGQ